MVDRAGSLICTYMYIHVQNRRLDQFCATGPSNQMLQTCLTSVSWQYMYVRRSRHCVQQQRIIRPSICKNGIPMAAGRQRNLEGTPGTLSIRPVLAKPIAAGKEWGKRGSTDRLRHGEGACSKTVGKAGGRSSCFLEKTWMRTEIETSPCQLVCVDMAGLTGKGKGTGIGHRGVFDGGDHDGKRHNNTPSKTPMASLAHSSRCTVPFKRWLSLSRYNWLVEKRWPTSGERAWPACQPSSAKLSTFRSGILRILAHAYLYDGTHTPYLMVLKW